MRSVVVMDLLILQDGDECAMFELLDDPRRYEYETDDQRGFLVSIPAHEGSFKWVAPREGKTVNYRIRRLPMMRVILSGSAYIDNPVIMDTSMSMDDDHVLFYLVEKK